MVQKASKIATKTDVMIRQNKKIEELFGLNRKRIPPLAGLFGTTPILNATPAAGGSSGGTGNFLRTAGDTMIGPIAFFPVDVNKDNSDNSIDIGIPITNVIPDYSTYVLVTGTGDLQFIDGAAWAGQYLILQGTNQQILTIKSISGIFTIDTISGTGSNNIITVVTDDPHGYSVGEIIQIDNTTNFNARASILTVPDANTFTYDLGSLGSATPETSGTAKNGTIITGNGNPIVLDGTADLLNAPIITLVFDITVVGNGAWRVVGTASGGSGGVVPDGTAENDHLEWDNVGQQWLAQQFFEMGEFGPHATLGDIRFKNDSINLAWRNALNTGEIELKASVGNFIDITNNANEVAGINLRTQNATFPDNSIAVSVGSGDAISTTALIDTNVALMQIGLGGASRLFFDVSVNTEMELRSPSASSIFQLRSEHPSDPDNLMVFAVASGAGTDALFDITGAVLKIGAGGETRLTLDVSVITQLDLRSSSAQALFQVKSGHPTDPDNVIAMTVTSGAGTDSLLEATGPLFKIGVAGSTRITLNDTTSQVEITFADLNMNGNDIILDADGDSKFDLSVDDILILNLAGTPEFVWSDTAFDISDKFQQFSQIGTPAVPPTLGGRLYAKIAASAIHPFWLENDGTETDLTLGGGGGDGGGGAGLTFASVVKSVAETVVSSTTFQDDDELTFVTEPNTVYAFKMMLLLTQNGGEFKFRWTLPTGATGTVSIDNITSASATLTQDITTSHTILTTGGLVTDVVVFEGRIVTGSEGGSANLQWAQNVSNPSLSAVLQGSYLRVYSDTLTTTAGTIGAIFAKIVKTADQTVNNTTTVVEDTELRFVGTANKVYSYLLWLYWESDQAALRRSWTLPSGATGGISGFELDGNNGIGLDDMTDERETIRGDAGELYSAFMGKVVMGGSTGSVIFNFAQFVANASDITILKGSTLIVYEEGSIGGGGTAVGTDDGRFHLLFEQRAQVSTILGDDSDDPVILAEWLVIPPAGLVIKGNQGQGVVDVIATLRRNQGSGFVLCGFQQVEPAFIGPPRDYDTVESVITQSASFVPRASNSRGTGPDVEIYVFSVFNSNTTTQGDVQEMKGSFDLTLPPGYTVIQTI